MTEALNLGCGNITWIGDLIGHQVFLTSSYFLDYFLMFEMDKCLNLGVIESTTRLNTV